MSAETMCKLGHVSAVINDLQKEIESIKLEVADKDSLISKLKEEVKEKDEIISNLTKEIVADGMSVESLDDPIKHLKNKISDLERRVILLESAPKFPYVQPVPNRDLYPYPTITF
jgi:chromosome segregation ATPase